MLHSVYVADVRNVVGVALQPSDHWILGTEDPALLIIRIHVEGSVVADFGGVSAAVAADCSDRVGCRVAAGGRDLGEVRDVRPGPTNDALEVVRDGGAILIPFTFSMDPLSALLMLASISVGAAFGGSVTSILLNIPGEASSAATAYDGYPMAQRGKAKVAMGLSAGASMVAAIVGVLILMFASGPVAKVALAFSPAEYFALAILGLTVVAVAALGSM